MITRFKLTAFVFLACLAIAAIVEASRVPVAQIELFAGNEVGPVVSAFAASGALAGALDALPDERRAAFVPAGATPGALQGVQIASVAPDRVRIRVASHDRAAASALAEGLRRQLVDAGVRERLSLSFVNHGGAGRLLIVLATVLAGLTFLMEWALWWRGSRSTRRAMPAAMRGAASI